MSSAAHQRVACSQWFLAHFATKPDKKQESTAQSVALQPTRPAFYPIMQTRRWYFRPHISVGVKKEFEGDKIRGFLHRTPPFHSLDPCAIRPGSKVAGKSNFPGRGGVKDVIFFRKLITQRVSNRTTVQRIASKRHKDIRFSKSKFILFPFLCMSHDYTNFS